jgi:hypothetical protein
VLFDIGVAVLHLHGVEVIQGQRLLKGKDVTAVKIREWRKSVI